MLWRMKTQHKSVPVQTGIN